MSNAREMNPTQLAERERVMSKLPKEADFIGRRGYERKYRDPGNETAGYDWRYNFKPNDGHGRGTREFHEVCEMLAPFTRAEEDRRHNAPAGPALADQTEGRNGRSRVRLAGGNRVERGTRWCLTTPHPWTPVPEGGNPDGSWA